MNEYFTRFGAEDYNIFHRFAVRVPRLQARGGITAFFFPYYA